MLKFLAIIESLIRARFTGKIEITFYEGGIRSVDKALKEKLL